MMQKPEQISEELWSMVCVDPVSGCWNWTGKKFRGYGQYGREFTHRIFFSAIRGPLIRGMVLDYEVCENPSCCNPYHVTQTTHKRNLCRSTLTVAGVNSRKTHCTSGHEYTEENTKIRTTSSGTHRVCLACQPVVNARNWAKRSGMYLGKRVKRVKN